MLSNDISASERGSEKASLAALQTAILAQENSVAIRFAPGDVLRQKGLHYRDMHILIDGAFEIDLEAGTPGSRFRISQPGYPIGEIGFLRGSPATATVKAISDGTVLSINDAVLERLERDHSALAAHLMQRLAMLADERTSFNLLINSQGRGFAKPADVEVLMCRTPELLKRAQRLRYDVYCGELGRQSPHADHDKCIIADDLDAFGQTFVALEKGEVIGTMRGNLSALGSLGVLEDQYGMKASPHHPRHTAICTKFIISKSKRGGPAAFKLIAAMVRYGAQNGVKECYVDCIPKLLPYYKAMGFVPAGERFLHRENGPSDPLKLDVVKHGARLTGEMGLPAYLGIFAKAQLIRLTSQMPSFLTIFGRAG